ncbi:unnamed protein product [Tilletia laevis]|uniref:Zn(2)-C6 fungal-type domain-containing protein n=3 Tax=Tilletia TaxID=13289 RepID=A0A8X7MZE3_9BASI|nr:hypothetical protein CF336_g19 [Tilletia laevis]KAE8205963.1 hypothetical protein CF328_g190 [Tilletia controversa]KAE8265638.1 hypothetical protein A4X03_0g131 [Tilletia caries]KAE8208970.1 hypothetical protein CF335_g21 [Tilletia laevis]KAE8255651.1 hypothetical protein A4X06_0g322 [Tilletia controversa]
MVKQDANVPSAFFPHDVDSHHSDPFGLHAFYNIPIGPNFHSRRGGDEHQHQTQHQQQLALLHQQQRPYIHQEPQDDIFALKGEPLPQHLQAPPLFKPDYGLSSTSSLRNRQGLQQHQHQQQSQSGEATVCAQDKDAASASSTSAPGATAATATVLLPPPTTNHEQQTLYSDKAEAGNSQDTNDDAQPDTASVSATAAPKTTSARAKASSSLPKKRTRPVSACEGCRAKKVKCNLRPDLPVCENCSSAGKPCLFRIDDLSPAFRAQRFGSYNLVSGDDDGSPRKFSISSVGGSIDGSRSIADDVPGETTSQRRMRRKRAREAILAAGQRPPKAKAVFKSWANPNKLAAPCMPFRLQPGTSTQNQTHTTTSPMMIMDSTVGMSANGSIGTAAPASTSTMALPLSFFDPSEAFSHPFAFGAPTPLINASGVFHAGTSMPMASPPDTALSSMVGSWDSTTAQFSSSFGSMSQHHVGVGGTGITHSLIPFPAHHATVRSSMDGSTLVGPQALVGSPQGSFTSSGYLDSIQSLSSSVDHPHTPGLTDGSGELLGMSPFSTAGGAGLSPTMTTAGVHGRVGNRPETHFRRHTTGPIDMASLTLPGAFGVDNSMGGHMMGGLDPSMNASGLVVAQQPFSFGVQGGGVEMQADDGGDGLSQHPFHAASLFDFQQQQQQQQQHQRASTANAFLGLLQGGTESMASCSIPTPTPFDHGMTHHAPPHHPPPPPPHRRPQTSSSFLSDWDALTGFPPREIMAESSVPVDLGMGLGAGAGEQHQAGGTSGGDDFLGGFDMTLA